MNAEGILLGATLMAMFVLLLMFFAISRRRGPW